MPVLLDVRSEVWPLKERFSISRGAKTAAEVVVVSLGDGAHRGRGESVPYARYGESVAGVIDDIHRVAGNLTTRVALLDLLPPGAARNALDCALWDLDCKRTGQRAAALANLPQPADVLTAYTISLATPEQMAEKALAVSNLPLLKLKLGGDGDGVRMRAVRAARPDARLLVDANEAWSATDLAALIADASDCGIEVIEQPLPAQADDALKDVEHLVPICADESVHTSADLDRISSLYDAVNIKLDKAGGLTGALDLLQQARGRGLKIMIGSMVATSLAVAPALLLAPHADWVDLDGPLLLGADREFGVLIENGRIFPPPPELWG